MRPWLVDYVRVIMAGVSERDPTVFGRNVRAFRNQWNWSMRELSKQAGLSLQTIANVEAGRGCSQSSEERLAKAFQTYVGRLWDAELLSEARQRVIYSNRGRWFFSKVERAKEYALRQKMTDEG